jgi:acetyl esterase/lipase
VPVRIYRPDGAQGGIIWLHGGGFVMGGLDVEHPWAARIAHASQAAQRLMEAGVPVELHQWRGTFHGSQAVLSADVSQRQIAELGTVLHHALGG